jgi:hypothetical protein
MFKIESLDSESRYDIIDLNSGQTATASVLGGTIANGGNLGSGAGIFAGTTGTTLYFKSLVAGSNITLTSSSTGITVSSTGGVSGSFLSGVTATNRKTSSYTIAATDVNKLVEMNVASSNTVTLPPASAVTIATGSAIHFAQYGAGQTQFIAGPNVTIRSYNTNTKLSGQYSFASAFKIGSNEYYLFGDLTS